jgi:hypothetical protein
MEIDHFALKPPEGAVFRCTCGTQIEEIQICTDNPIATVQPCGCYLTPDDVEQIMLNQDSA